MAGTVVHSTAIVNIVDTVVGGICVAVFAVVVAVGGAVAVVGHVKVGAVFFLFGSVLLLL